MSDPRCLQGLCLPPFLHPGFSGTSLPALASQSALHCRAGHAPSAPGLGAPALGSARLSAPFRTCSAAHPHASSRTRPGLGVAGALLAVQLFMCGFVEVKRWQDFRKPGSQAEPGSFLGFESSFKGVENGYPGGPFDFMGLSK